jgi:hypothetical protein
MTWMLTYSGRRFDPIDPQPEMFDLLDIAHGLSQECRYAGQCRLFYSVAQHSVLVSQIVPPQLAFEALLHDATEAYIKDIPRPIKALLPDYRQLEARIDAAIRRRFGLPEQPSPEVKHADLVLLATERRDLMPDTGGPWASIQGIQPMDKSIRAAHVGRAKSMFLERVIEILQGGKA